MCKLNELFQELGISKVRLAKYLGVSRQMVYNYLELNDINKWPKEKKLLLFKLLANLISSTDIPYCLLIPYKVSPSCTIYLCIIHLYILYENILGNYYLIFIIFCIFYYERRIYE